MTLVLPSKRDVVLYAQLAEMRRRGDPLRDFRWQCDGARRFAGYVAQGLDTHAHTGNQGTKTTSGAALVVALLQGRPELDGVKLPKLELPATAWLMVKTRKGQVDSSQKAYRQVIGEWPAKEAFSDKGRDYVETWRIRPLGWTNDDPASWSKIAVHCEESKESLPGGRVDIIHADEPPKRENWREARWRGKSNRALYLFITETPIFKSEWWWLFHEEDGYLGCLDRPKAGRVSVNWDVRDVACHSDAHKRGLEEKARGDPHGLRIVDGLEQWGSRLTGWPVDDEGASPFDGRGLALIRAECVEPRLVTVPLFATGADDSDRATLAESVSYSVWVSPKEWGQYSGVGDPSLGYREGDPSGFLIGEEVDPAIVAEHNGWLDPYSFGWLLGTVGKDYNHAAAHVEMQGGYGSEAVRALRRMQYPNIGHRTEINDPTGQPETKYGFANSDGARRSWMAAIQAVLKAKVRGETLVKIWSRELVDEIADTLLDDKGRVVKAPGRHIERVICLGYWLHRLGLPREARRQAPGTTDRVGQLLRRELGRDVRPTRSGNLPGAFRR